MCVEAGLAIIFPAQLQQTESIPIRSQAPVCRFVQVNKAPFDHEYDLSWLGRIFGDDEGMSFASGFEDERSRLRNPIML
jgi:hypothetical protein